MATNGSKAVNRRTMEKRMRLINRRLGCSQSHLTDHRWNIAWFAFHPMRVQQDLCCNIHSFAKLLFRQECFNWHSMFIMISPLHRFRRGTADMFWSNYIERSESRRLELQMPKDSSHKDWTIVVGINHANERFPHQVFFVPLGTKTLGKIYWTSLQSKDV